MRTTCSDDLVTRETGVAVDQSRAGGRRDHERRVGGDQVERLVPHRVEERTRADLDVRQLVEGRVELRRPHGPGVDVGGDDGVGVGRQVQRLDSAPGAEVEGPGDRLAQRELGQRGRGGADAEHVVVGDADVRAVEAGREVGDDPQVAVVGGVRADVEQRAYLAAGGTEEAGVLELADQPGQGALGVLGGDRRLEQEQPGQRGERRAVARPPQGRRGLVAAERLVGAGAEQVGDGVVGEAGGLQGRAQTKGQVRHVGPAPLVVSRADRRQTVGETGWVGVGSLTGAGGTGVSGPSLPIVTSRCLEM